MKKTIRVIRTYEVKVEAEYGDTEESLIAKGQETVSDKTKYTESAVLLPDPDEKPQYASVEEMQAAEQAEFDKSLDETDDEPTDTEGSE
jgi:hypothetical protein